MPSSPILATVASAAILAGCALGGELRNLAANATGIEGSRFWARPAWGPTPRPDRHSQRLGYITEAGIRSDQQPQIDELHCRYDGYRADGTAGLPRTPGVSLPATAPNK